MNVRMASGNLAARQMRASSAAEKYRRKYKGCTKSECERRMRWNETKNVALGCPTPSWFLAQQLVAPAHRIVSCLFLERSRFQ